MTEIYSINYLKCCTKSKLIKANYDMTIQIISYYSSCPLHTNTT